MNRNHLVDVRKVIPDAIIDMKYATTDNIAKKVVYQSDQCYLLEHVVQALKAVSDDFKKLGYVLKIWDAYRPLSVQYVFWNFCPDERYVANPKYGSKHNRGCAVDVTLADTQGHEIAMGTKFDDFTEKAHRNYKMLDPEVLKYRELLQTIMEKHGFIGWENEWWHFDFHDWQQHELLNIPFDALRHLDP